MSVKDDIRPQRLSDWWTDVIHGREEQSEEGRKTRRAARLVRTVGGNEGPDSK